MLIDMFKRTKTRGSTRPAVIGQKPPLKLKEIWAIVNRREILTPDRRAILTPPSRGLQVGRWGVLTYSPDRDRRASGV